MPRLPLLSVVNVSQATASTMVADAGNDVDDDDRVREVEPDAPRFERTEMRGPLTMSSSLELKVETDIWNRG